MLETPRNADPYLTRLVRTLNAELVRKEPTLVGVVLDGSTLRVRFRSPLDVPQVQVQVQSTGVGEGGMTYDPANYISTTLVDCRAERLQDVTVSMTPGVPYVVFLIPVQYDGAGTKVLYDGQAGRPDAMASIGTGVAAGGGAPAGAITDPSGGAVQDAEARTATIDLLNVLRATGVSAPVGGLVVDAETRAALSALLAIFGGL